MAKLLVRGLVLGFILNALVMEQGKVGVTGSDENADDGSVFEHIVAANEATKKLYESQANAADTKSEIASNLKEESLKFYQGDIVLDAETYNLIKSSKSSREKRNAIRRKSSLWTSRIIPYHLPPKMGHIRTNLQIAISEIQQKTCLRFVPYSGIESNYIYFDDNRGCSSMIGKYYSAPGKQTISIAGGCRSSGTILHELLHAIGFWHEQSRPDRDKYVRVNYENIPSSERDQFDSYSWQSIDDLGKSYDFQSIMHYGQKAFTINGKTTIEAIHDPNLKLGSQDGHLSAKDVIEINALYDCDTSSHGWTEWSSFTPCDNNCRKSRQRYCYHPRNDYSQCIGANPYGIHKQEIVCSQCPVPIDGHWGNWGQWTPCSATCDDGGRKRTRQCNNPYPAHGGKQCEGLAEEDALCMVKRCLLDKDDTDFEYNRMGIWYNRRDDSFDWRLLKGPTQTIDTGPFYDHTSGRGTYLYTESSAPRLKGDTAKLSTRWMPYVPGGQCVKFAYHMFGKTTGALTLRVDLQGQDSPYYIFDAKGSQKNDWLTGMGDIDLPTSVAGYRLTFEAVLGGTGYSDIAIDDVYIDPGLCDCQDDYVTCKKWASQGECSKNADWMAKHCKRSCKKCVQATIAASLTLKPTQPFCSDNDPVQCPLWANRGECTINPDYMNKNCADSCAICDCKDSDPVQCPLWAAKGICKSNPAYMLVKCIKSCNVCRCHDKNVGCMQWAARGECAKNPLFMKPNCRRSCNICK